MHQKPTRNRSPVESNQLKSSPEKCSETISQSYNIENLTHWRGENVFSFVPYNYIYEFFSIIIFGVIQSKVDFQENDESSLLSVFTASNQYLGESLIQDARIQLSMKR